LPPQLSEHWKLFCSREQKLSGWHFIEWVSGSVGGSVSGSVGGSVGGFSGWVAVPNRACSFVNFAEMQ